MTDAISQVAGQLCTRPMSRLTIVATMAVFDVLVMSLGLWFAAFGAHSVSQFAPFSAGLQAALCAVFVAGFNILAGAYRPGVLARIKLSILKAAPGVLLLTYLANLIGLASVPVLDWVFLAVPVVLSVTLLLRLAAHAFVRWAMTFGALERRAIVAGGGEPAKQLISTLSAHPENDIRVVAIFDDRDDERSPQQVLGVPNLGGFDDVLQFVAVAEVDLVLVTLPLEAKDRINWLLATFKALPHDVHLVDFSRDLKFETSGEFGFVLAQESSFDIVRRWQKRVFDLVFGLLSLVICAPIMLIAALAIRLETPGPVFFSQVRHGFANRTIRVLKFRSMYHDLADDTGTDVVKRGGDPRVTRVGALLRKTSIDELPQLLCVLRGDLSLVGPRPHALEAQSSNKEAFASLVEDYASRHRLPPGITGWAQVNGFRGGIDKPEELRARVAHDLYYIENWSIWFDLRILLRTPLAVIYSKNAY